MLMATALSFILAAAASGPPGNTSSNPTSHGRHPPSTGVARRVDGSNDGGGGGRGGIAYPSAQAPRRPKGTGAPRKTDGPDPANKKHSITTHRGPTTTSLPYFSVPDMKCTMTSTALATDGTTTEAETAWCICIGTSVFSRPLNTDPHIADPCPATASHSGITSMAALDKLRDYNYTSSGYIIGCEWGKPNTFSDAADATEVSHHQPRIISGCVWTANQLTYCPPVSSAWVPQPP